MNVTPFNDKNQHKSENMLKMIKKVYASKPPGMLMYIPKMDKYGRPVIDKDGVALYRSMRGTRKLETLHP